LERQFGNYRIIDKLGEGGMGEVYRGVDTMLEREVAIKLLRPELNDRPDIVERFRTEAIALARLNHQHIATLYNFSRDSDQWYMSLEFVRGETLADRIARQGALPWREAIRIAAQALEGLEHAHRLGVVHRDIKPSNIMLTQEGEIKLMDFGIARILGGARLTRTGHLIGTLEYISPEQVQGKDTDARSDIYSLGAVLYEILTGHLPFEKNTDFDLLRSQVEEMPLSPRILSPGIPLALEAAVLKAMAKQPEERYRDAAEFRAALLALAADDPRPQAALETRPMGAVPEGPSSLGTLASKARAALSALWKDYPGAVVMLLLTLAGGVVLGAGYLLASGRSDPVGAPVRPDGAMPRTESAPAIETVTPIEPPRFVAPPSEPSSPVEKAPPKPPEMPPPAFPPAHAPPPALPVTSAPLPPTASEPAGADAPPKPAISRKPPPKKTPRPKSGGSAWDRAHKDVDKFFRN
jgi:serine/threonine-protein kinase